jgi:hypothetical protein
MGNLLEKVAVLRAVSLIQPGCVPFATFPAWQLRIRPLAGAAGGGRSRSIPARGPA